MTTQHRRRQKQKRQREIIMAEENKEANSANTPKSAGKKTHVFVTKTVKYNGTFYGNTVVAVDDAVAQSLIRTGSARMAEADEIKDWNESNKARDPFANTMGLDLKNSPELKNFAEDIESAEPAVDEDGNEIPNSIQTDERKLRDTNDNTVTTARQQARANSDKKRSTI